MIKVILYIAISLDGFIADKNGGVAWLDKYNNGTEDCGFRDFYNSIDALVFGKNTYEQVLTFGPWSFASKKSYIFADKTTTAANQDIEIITTDISTFMKKIQASGIKRLWLMGGAQLTQSFLDLGLIDEYILTIIPEKLGTGIALPQAIFHAQNLLLTNEISYPSLGIIQKHYINKR